MTTNEFIDKAKLVHGEKYDYSQVDYKRTHEKVKIICKEHGVFEQCPSDHLRNHGCPLCTKHSPYNLKTNGFVQKSICIHGDVYDYSKVVYVNNKKAVEIICREHGSFFQTPNKHLIGHGCPKCCKNIKDTTESFIVKAKAKHGDLYDYSKVQYIDQHTKVCIIDPDYGEFWQTPNAHLNGEGCWLRRKDKCHLTKKRNSTFHVSRPANVMYDMLVKKFGRDNVVREYTSAEYPYSCDFYIKSLSLYIELNAFVTHGFHWFDATDKDDLARLEVYKSRMKNRNMYEKIVYVWTVSDPQKKNIAIKNNLNYVVFWKDDLSDFIEWYNDFDNKPILKKI